MYIIGIDPSINSTAISIYDEEKIHLFNYTTKKLKYKWFTLTTEFINYNATVSVNDSSCGYSKLEIKKITSYDEITNSMLNNIIDIIGEEKCVVYIEGYSYSSDAGKIIDLVTFSTLIRHKLLSYPNITLHIIAPSELKKCMGEFVYDKDKKGVCRNSDGKAAGSFDKKDMMIALMKLELNYPYMKYLSENQEILLTPKNIPKPFDDINDAIILTYFGCVSNDLKI